MKRTKIMPAKSVDAFFEKVGQDKSLQAKLKALHQKTLRETKGIKGRLDPKETRAIKVIRDY